MIRFRLNTRSSGFTIIEVIVVIAVISILAGSMAPMISQRIEAAREDSTRIKMETLRKALVAYAKDTGRFPTEQNKGPDSLLALEAGGKKPPAGWRGPYIIGTYANQDYTRDAWNSDYRYRINRPSKNAAPQVILTSIGSDRTRRTKDDIVLTIPMPMEDISERIERTKARLKLIEGDIYGSGGEGAPGAYKIPTQWEKDAWGKSILYKRYNDFSAAIYSGGPNGIDDKLSKDDLYRALVWSPKDGISAAGSGKATGNSGTTVRGSSGGSSGGSKGSGKGGKQSSTASGSGTTTHTGKQNGQSSGTSSGSSASTSGGGKSQGQSGAATGSAGGSSGGASSAQGSASSAGSGKAGSQQGSAGTSGGSGSASTVSSRNGSGSGKGGISGSSGGSGSSGTNTPKPLSGTDIQKLSPRAISSVPPEQIAKMSQSDFNKLSLKQRVMLTTAQLAERKRADAARASKYYQFKDLSADQMKYLTKKQIASIPNTWWLKTLSYKQKMAMTKEQIQAMNTKKIAIDALPESKRDFLNKKQVQDIARYDYFKYLNPGQVSQLTTKQVGSIPSGWWMNSLSRKQKMALSKEQIQALNTSKVSISTLPEEKRAHLTTSQIQSVSSHGDFRYLEPAQVAKLKPKQIASIPNTWWMNTLSRKQREALTKSQVQAINTKKISIESLPEAKRVHLKTSQIQAIGTYADYRHLEPDQVSKLTRQQIAKIPNGWWMNTLSKQQKQALTKKQVQAINTKKVTIDTLLAEKRAFLTTKQVQSIGRYNELRYVPADKISNLKPQQIAKIPNDWWMNRFSNAQMHNLTKSQVKAIRSSFYKKVEKRLTAKQRKWRA